ncbi:3-oxoacyl-[acyl-carrier-protein] reductase FabG-like [Oppia nitens]|uniref:3-oxoacyl-[acyl-carrier-protein] reductase FabG-like n=1 Tax=Oppia nitens TaxID=1686743 RepID=UPI0023DB0C62|nr:3-oxoacyl-[acyl-carrier-protein] reductase FabG-like [Oppia nitens]
MSTTTTTTTTTTDNLRDFTGKVVVITGSSSCIGAAAALEFATAGAQVVVVGRNRERIASVAKQCADISPTGLAGLEIVADITDDEDCKRLIDETIGAFNRLDVLVNNAGYGVSAAVTDEDFTRKLDQMIGLHVRSLIQLTRLSVPYLTKTNGNIVNISSLAAFHYTKSFGPYCIAKCAQDMYSKCAAVELSKLGIRVNTINPGLTRTGIMTQAGVPQLVSDQLFDKWGSKLPLGRPGDAREVARAIRFLASGEASFITGTGLTVDGGHLAANTDLTVDEVIANNLK